MSEQHEEKELKEKTKHEPETEPDMPPKQQVNTGLVSLDIVAKMNNTDIDMRAVVREYGIATAETSPEEIIRIAKNKGFKVKKRNSLKRKFLIP